MFTDALIASPLILMAVLAAWIYWRALGSGFDNRIFIGLNFGLITVWAAVSDAHLAIRLGSLLFMSLVLIGYRLPRSSGTTRRIDSALDIDLAPVLLLISCIGIYVNIQSGVFTLSAQDLLLEQRAEDALTRYRDYLLLTGGWLTIHVTCRSAAQPRWTTLQKVALTAAIVSASTSLSKASFLPILLALLFVYSARIGKWRLLVLAGTGLVLALVATQRLFEDLTVLQVAQLFFTRVVKNVEVLDYIDELGLVQSLQYPHASPFYLFWPAFQLTQSDYVGMGIWFRGALLDDWRGFGPNPTFVGDLLMASYGVGLLLAPVFGWLLRAADRSPYRVFLAMVIYQFMQDWNYSCLVTGLFIIILLLGRAFGRVDLQRAAQPASRPR